jgi:transcriptional regulator
MYVPAHFRETRAEVLHELIRAWPLAALVHVGPDGLGANHVPLLLDAAEPLGTLRGHVARANPIHAELRDDSPVLAIFQGPSHYVSPSWYPSKHAHGKDVPTWNYMVVHAHGRIRWRPEPDWLLKMLNDLTDAQEGGRARPWSVSDAPADFISQAMKAIVGFEIAIERLTGKWKLSQNREAPDRDGAIAGLDAEPDEAARLVAARMKALATAR